MIEVLFAESEAASMKAAKNMAAGGVICLGLLLDIGDIREETDSTYRRDLIYSMYAQEQRGSGEAEKEEKAEKAELLGLCGIYQKELCRLREYLEAGEMVRAWYSGAPYSLCGFYHLCSILLGYENEVRAVRLPEYKVRPGFIVSYTNWGEVPAEEFAGFLSCEKRLSPEEIRMYASLWHELREDNSPLRAAVNGRLAGVPEDFYDFLIWKRMTGKPEKEARIIGDILGRSRLGVGDWWYARRIDFWIGQGKIRVSEDSEKKYARMICLECRDMLELVKPSERYGEQVMAYRKEMLENGDSFDGCAGLEDVESFAGWLDFETRLQAKFGDGYVPSDVYLAVRRRDGRVVGIAEFRHQLTEFLLNYGGNIGYCIRPSERRKGYASELLRLLLPKCRGFGADKVLLTCDKENEASRKVILKNHGILENEVADLPGLGCSGTIQRYWLKLPEET